jgi:hypothetical protein
MTYMSGAGAQAGVMMSIENVSFNETGKVYVTVRNAGTSDTKLARIYIGTSETNLVKDW